MLVAVVMAAVFPGRPIGCLVSPSPLSSQNVPSHEKAPARPRARGETPTMSFALGANREDKKRVNGKANRKQSSRIGSVLVCVRRNAQSRELKLLEFTQFELSIVVMIAVFTEDGPAGCLVSHPPLFPQNIQSHEKAPIGHGNCCGTEHRLLLPTTVPIATIPGAGVGWRKSS